VGASGSLVHDGSAGAGLMMFVTGAIGGVAVGECFSTFRDALWLLLREFCSATGCHITRRLEEGAISLYGIAA
jgi:hypothetical protein